MRGGINESRKNDERQEHCNEEIFFCVCVYFSILLKALRKTVCDMHAERFH